VSVWIEAARPRTLPAAVAPVLVGTAAAEAFGLARFVGALIVALSLQIAVNYANDYYDGVAGIDTPDRTGPRRAVAAGVVAPAAMRQAMLGALALAAVVGFVLAAVAGWELLVVGVLAIIATVGYSGTSRPYASRGLGEVSVFVFFGVVATVGSQYVQDERWSWIALAASVPVGALATALLVVNNLRDIPTDAITGKRTLAVRIGEQRTRALYTALVWLPLYWSTAMAGIVGTPWLLLPLLATPLAWRASDQVQRAPIGPALVPALELTGLLHLVYGGLLAAGLLFRGVG
jgi:1,4-dihydroxy-2-naphthoate polyprenyltransferase